MTPEKTEWIWGNVAQALPKERAVNKDNHFIVICMFAGMLPGLAIGFVIGIFQGNIGITVCFGLVSNLVRLAPIVLIGAIAGIFLTRKKV